MEDKGLPEMGFTLGGVDEAIDPAVLVGLAVDADGTVHGVTSWMPVYGTTAAGSPSGWTLDVMRRLPDGFRYSMEFLIASACLAFRDEGAASSRCPAHRSPRPDPGTGRRPRHPLDGFLDRLGGTLEPLLRLPVAARLQDQVPAAVRAVVPVFPDEAALPRIGVALSRAYLPEAGLRDLLALARPPSRTRATGS